MTKIRSVAVFCGSSLGGDPVFTTAARELGQGLAQAGLRLVYGGGHVGLMGVLADAAVAAGGEVIGVIPEFLERREVAHHALTELIITDTMHDRKRRMFDMADAFVTLPGGLGTMDETFEILTWRQLRLHDKPILLCDVAGQAAPLLALLDSVIANGFARPETAGLYEAVRGVPAVLERLRHLNMAAAGEAPALL